MDNSIPRVGERMLLQPRVRDRRAKERGDGSFRRDLEHASSDEQGSLRDEVLIPRPRTVDQRVAPPTADEVGTRVDVEA